MAREDLVQLLKLDQREKQNIEQERLATEQEKLKADLQDIRHSYRRNQDEEDKFRNEMRKDTTEVRNSVNTLVDPRDDVSMVKIPPVPGEDGYLIKECIAPAGQDQKVYQASLIRAAIFYTTHFKWSDDGFDADEEAFEATLERYPQLLEDHIVKAIKHWHLQAYRVPFNNVG